MVGRIEHDPNMDEEIVKAALQERKRIEVLEKQEAERLEREKNNNPQGENLGVTQEELEVMKNPKPDPDDVATLYDDKEDE